MALFSGKRVLTALLITTAILVLAGIIYGFYLEDNEAIVAAILYGEFGKPGSDQYLTDLHFLMWPAMAWLSASFKWVPVYGLYYLMLTALWLFALVHYAIKNLVSNQGVKWIALILTILIILLLTADSIMYHHCIRISILLAFASMLYSEDNDKRSYYYFSVFLFVIALFTRTHAAPIILGMFSVYAVLKGRGIVATIKKYLPHYILAFVFVCTYQILGTINPNTGKYIETNYEYAILEKRSLLPQAAGSTARDSMKYEALFNFFITDSAQFTKEYFAATVNTAPQASATLSADNIKRAVGELAGKTAELSIVLLPMLLILLVGLLAPLADKKRGWGTIIAFVVTAAVPLALVLFLVDEMKIRFFSPFMAVACYLILREAVKLNAAPKWAQALIASLLLVAGFYKVTSLYTISSQEKAANEQRYQAALRLKSYSADKKLIAFVFSDIPLTSTSLKRDPDGFFSNIGYFDAGYLTYYSYTVQRFSSMYGVSPLDYQALIGLFKSGKTIYGYAVEERLLLIKKYFKVMYGVDFVYKLLPQQPQLGLNGKIYTLSIE